MKFWGAYYDKNLRLGYVLYSKFYSILAIGFALLCSLL